MLKVNLQGNTWPQVSVLPLCTRGKILNGHFSAFGSILALSMGRKATTLAPIPVVFTAVGASVAAYYAVSIYNRNSSVL